MAASMLVSFAGIIFLLIFNVGGDEEAQSPRCPGLGQACNQQFVKPCCIDTLECRPLNDHKNKFICTQKDTLVELNETVLPSMLGGPCKINQHCKPENSVCIDNECQCRNSFAPAFDRTCVRKILGSPCIDDLCEKIQYARCSDNICECSPNTVAVTPTRCQPMINTTCTSDLSCMVKNSHCIDHKCQCWPQYIPTANQECLPTVLGQSCSDDADCLLITNAKCYEKTCFCRENYLRIKNNKCGPLLNEYCSEKNPCMVDNSECIDQKCQCSAKFRFFGNAKCITVFKVKTCTSDSDCWELENGACSNRICGCKASFIRADQTRCDPMLNQPCRKSDECATPNSSCIDRKCQCDLSYFQRGANYCLPGILRASCITNEDCEEILNSECAKNKCQCRVGFVEISKFACKKPLDGPCTEDTDCFVNNTVCSFNRCQCEHNYLPLSESQCRSAYVDKNCNNDDDCKEIKNSFCSIMGACVCDHNHAPLNGVCAPLLNFPCKSNQQCAVENAFCIDGECQCSSKYAPRSNYQCKLNQLGEKCKSDTDCNFIKNAQCSDQKCQCRMNYVRLSSTTCGALNGESCSDGDCVVAYAACIDNECQCSPGFITTRDSCEPLPYRQFCIDDNDCSKLNTECSPSQKCVCKRNYPEINSTDCGSWLFDSCLTNEDCVVKDSMCIDTMCRCRSHYVLETIFKCIPISLGGRCNDNVDCSAISNALCSDKHICVCVKDTYSLGNLICLPSVGKVCQSKQDCFSLFLDCIDNKCQCIPNFVTVSSSQCVARNLAFSCGNNYDCGEPWHSECSKTKKCVCKLNSYATNMSTCRPLLGGYCWKNNQCLTKGSECDNFQCKCKDGFVAVANNLCVPSRAS